MILHKRNDKMWEQMKSDCSQCSGLCCTALFFSKMDGFPKDKIAGKPCINLLEDYRCKIHSQLEKQKMKGCIGYDCFGAGQQVTQIIYKGQTWRTLAKQSQEIFDVFCAVFRMYQMRYFLAESMLIIPAEPIREDIQSLLEENIEICQSAPKDILSFDIESYRQRVNPVLRKVCTLLQQTLHSDEKQSSKVFMGKSLKGRDMSGLDFSTKILIGADFSNGTFNGTIFLGADTRDTNFSNADLSEAVFLTQGQINSAKGNRNTKIPRHLYYPITWRIICI